ncbi:hypothetical protein VNG_1598H [Halobacterium salinarum NRC-1]|uniref:Spurious ORF n=1 Tax=Halobacterium salinarum (strain ATCC 700922 / JCM 11081 / NRC-1) TaxID=64091 RepID=Q9HPK1_HALSA|nr:hypothetical protein VNG_1598H [Halobacterium salinarum NRC-1]DAC78592.1 TPA_inf: spurious ORF [Halobacterium salinarum NRC-1]
MFVRAARSMALMFASVVPSRSAISCWVSPCSRSVSTSTCRSVNTVSSAVSTRGQTKPVELALSVNENELCS